MESNKSSPEPSGLSKAIYWDPNSLFFYGGSDGDTLEICCGHDYEYCTLRTREDFVLTVAGIQKLEVKTSMENNYQICNIRQRIHRWHSYTLYLCAPEPMLKSIHRCSWSIFDAGAWRFTQDPTTLSRVQRLNYYLCSPPINVPRFKHVWQHEVWQHGNKWSDFT